MNVLERIFARILPGHNAQDDVVHTRQTFNYLGRCNTVDNPIVARPAFVHTITVSNPTASVVDFYLVDATSGSGAAAGEQRLHAQPNSCVTHTLNRRFYNAPRVQGPAAFPANFEISGIGN